MIEDEATVKRLGHDGPRVMLIPENPSLEPFEMSDGRILGKVVAVLTIDLPGEPAVRLIPLGGLGEIGLNMMLVESGDDAGDALPAATPWIPALVF